MPFGKRLYRAVFERLAPEGLSLPVVEWQPSRFLDVALHEASLDDGRLNADWIRRRRSGESAGSVDAVALEVLMYWQAWHHAVRGDLVSAWSLRE